MIQLKPQPPQEQRGTALDDLKEGLRYVVSHPTIRMLIVVVMVTMVFGMSFITLMPAWTVKVLRGDSTTNGFLQSARGVGSLMGGLMIASFARTKINGKLLTLGSLIFPVLVAGLVDHALAAPVVAGARRRRMGYDAGVQYGQYPRAVALCQTGCGDG